MNRSLTCVLTFAMLCGAAASALAGGYSYGHRHVPSYTTIFCVEYRADHLQPWTLYGEFPSQVEATQIAVAISQQQFEVRLLPKRVLVGYVCRPYVRLHHHHHNHHKTPVWQHFAKNLHHKFHIKKKSSSSMSKNSFGILNHLKKKKSSSFFSKSFSGSNHSSKSKSGSKFGGFSFGRGK